MLEHRSEELFNIPVENSLVDEQFDAADFDIHLTQKNINFLDARDRWYFSEGGQSVVEQFLVDFPQQLPDAIVLPDTSGRMLYYFLHPILKEIAKTRGITEPKYFFFGLLNDDEIKMQITELERNPNIDEETRKKRIKKLKILLRNKKLLAEHRAIQIQSYIDKPQEEQTIVLFDEYLVVGRTFEKIRIAFGKKLKAYAVARVDHDYPDSQLRFGGYFTTETPPSGFGYRELKKGIGVRKPNAHRPDMSTKLQESDLKKRLREAIEYQAKKVLAQIMENQKNHVRGNTPSDLIEEDASEFHNDKHHSTELNVIEFFLNKNLSSFFSKTVKGQWLAIFQTKKSANWYVMFGDREINIPEKEESLIWAKKRLSRPQIFKSYSQALQWVKTLKGWALGNQLVDEFEREFSNA